MYVQLAFGLLILEEFRVLLCYLL